MTDRELMQQALEALELAKNSHGVLLLSDPPQDPWKTLRVDSALTQSITALRERLAQPEQEPVAWKDEQGNVRMTLNSGEIQSSVGYVYSVHGEHIKNACIRSDIPNGTPLYTSPPASKPWVGLTDEEIWSDGDSFVTSEEGIKQFARAIEAKLRKKNT